MKKEATICLKKQASEAGRNRKKGFNARLFFSLLILFLNFVLFQWTDLFVHTDELSLVFLLDTSISMAGDPLQEGIESIWTCLYSLRDHERISLVTFSDSASERIPLTSQHEAVFQELTKVEAWGKTDITYGLFLAEKILTEEEAGRSREILLITDGLDGSERIPDSLYRKLAAEEIHVSVLGLLGNENTDLKRLAEETKGSFVSPGEDYLRVLGRLRSRRGGHRLPLFLLFTGLEELIFFVIFSLFSMFRKRMRTLPNAGYLKQDEIASFLKKKNRTSL